MNGLLLILLVACKYWQRFWRLPVNIDKYLPVNIDKDSSNGIDVPVQGRQLKKQPGELWKTVYHLTY